MLGLLEIGDRHLVGPPGPFDGLAVDEFRPRPSLGRAKDDHGPARTLHGCRLALCPGLALKVANARQDRIERAGKALMHDVRIVAFDEMRFVAVAAQQIGQLRPSDPRQHRRIGDLVAVEMQDRQHRAVACRVQEFVGVPARGQRPGFRLAVADDAGDDQIRIVEGRAIGMQQRIAQFAALVDGAGRFRRHVTGDPVGPGELPEQAQHAAPAALDGGIALGVRAFQVGLRHDPRTAMAGTDDVDHVQVVFLDQPVEVDVEEVQSRRRAPVTKQSRFDVLELERRIRAADCPAGRSVRPRGSSPRASRRASCGGDRATGHRASRVSGVTCARARSGRVAV